MKLTRDTSLDNTTLEVFQIESLEDFRAANAQTEDGLLIALLGNKFFGLPVDQHQLHVMFYRDEETLQQYINAAIPDLFKKMLFVLEMDVRALNADGLDRIYAAHTAAGTKLFFMRSVVEAPTTEQLHNAVLN